LLYCNVKAQEMVKVLRDPKQLEVFENPNYVRILSILRQGELNIKEVHKLFNKGYEDKKTLTTMYRYMEKLAENDLVFMSREKMKRKHLIERYYSRTAMFFLFQEERFEKNAVDATFELLQEIYDSGREDGKELKELLKEHGRNMKKCEEDFFQKYGEEILKLEEKYGFKAAKHATYTLNELLYFKKNPELLENIFKVPKV